MARDLQPREVTESARLINYVRDRLAAADTLDEIRAQLRRKGLNRADADLAIESATHGTVAAQYPLPDTPKERRIAELVFLVLFVLVALGLVAYFALKGRI